MSFKFNHATLLLAVFLMGTAEIKAQSGDDQPEQEATSAQEQTPAAKKGRMRKLPEDVPGLQKMAVESYQAENYIKFLQATIELRKLRPYEQQYMIGMVAGAARIGRPNTAYNYMHVMQQQGLSYDFNETDDSINIRGTEVYDHLNGLLIEAGQPVGDSRIAFSLAETKIQPETIAWDGSRGKFLIGTIDTGVILAVTPAGEIEELMRSSNENGLLAIMGIAVDEERNRLWVNTAGVPHFENVVPTELGRGALMEFNLESLELVKRHDIPVDGLPHIPAGIEISDSGDIYFIDRAVPMVFRKKADESNVEVFLVAQQMVGFKDIAMSDSGELIYLADSDLGIQVVNIVNETMVPLAVSENFNQGGISGLMYFEGDLFMLQNGTHPDRLLRLQLGQGGVVLENVAPLAVASEHFDSPSLGVIEGGSVYYFASSNQAGLEPESKATVILKSPVLLLENIIPAEHRKYQADMLEKQSQKDEN
jgi:hypothetical protein